MKAERGITAQGLDYLTQSQSVITGAFFKTTISVHSKRLQRVLHVILKYNNLFSPSKDFSHVLKYSPICAPIITTTAQVNERQFWGMIEKR
jgi:hypothetical protein